MTRHALSILCAATLIACGGRSPFVPTPDGSAPGPTLAFGPPIITMVPTQAGGADPADEVALADFDGDGKLDVVHSSVGGVFFGVMPGTGDGHFTPKASGQHFGWGPAVADYSGDGKPDFAVGYSSVDVLVNDGTGSVFQDKNVQVMSQNGITGLLPIDLTGDGKIDLAVATSPYLAVLVNGGTTVYTNLQFASTMVGGDFNGDGKKDLAVLNSDGGPPAVGIFLGDGTGHFTPGQSLELVEQTTLAAADLNGDGHLDLVVPAGPGEVAVLIGTSAGTFMLDQAYPAGQATNDIDAMVVADLNGDGFGDLIAIDAQGGAFSVLLGRGDGTFAAARVFLVPTADRVRPTALAVGDLDGDGKLDVVVAGGQQLTALLNQSTP